MNPQNPADAPTFPFEVVSQMREALEWCYEMLMARDAMNAKIHCAPMRLSPITERVELAIQAHDEAKALARETEG